METWINGVSVAFLLDTSSSMIGEGFEQMKKVFLSIIQEYSDEPSIDHCVAVISFGKEVQVLQKYSNDYSNMLHILDDIECEGPSSLKQALMAAYPFLRSGLNGSFIGPFYINANLVIISGGDVSGEDENEINDKQREVLSMARLIGSENPIVCVQVGDNPDKRFLGGIAFSSRYGKLLDIYEAPQFARYPTNMVVASKIIGSVPTTKYSVDDVREALKSKEEFASITEKDIGDIFKILTNRHAYGIFSCQSNSTDNDLQLEGDPRFPPIGTRVRRGPCWPFSNQDSCMPGTVIGYRNGYSNLLVEWDTSMVFPYHFDKYGFHQISNVEVCDVPRVLQTEKIAVGCLVQRGPDWKWFDQDGGNDNIGTVYKVKRDNTIFVQWFNGTKGNYRFGYDNKYDVKVCNPLDENVMKKLENQQRDWHSDVLKRRFPVFHLMFLHAETLKKGTEEWDELLEEGLKVNENTSTNLNTKEAYGEKEDSTSQSSQTEDELLDEGQIDQENTSTNQNTGEDYGEQENSNSKGSQEEDECDESENELDEGQKIQKNTLQNQNSGQDYEEQNDPNSKGEE
ncbi:uncharacterized protein [Magallana gigas]|uniref:uncharacterized protein n=1 Tax=Magallana gigas TaxID=29159 RepID=UPI003340A5DD